jgi:hypothetical protein
MSMFNWQAAPGQSVVASRFWMYWAVTIPLTVFVLVVWLSWLSTHNHSEKTPFDERMAALSRERRTTKPDLSSFGPPRRTRTINYKKSHTSGLWPSLTLFRAKEKVKTEEEGRIELELGQDLKDTLTTSIDQGDKQLAARRKSSLVQGPRR